MTVTNVKIPYEILIRFGDDGKPKGVALYQRHVVSMDGEVLKDEIGNAEPVGMKGFDISGLMTDATRDALQTVIDTNAKNADLAAQVADAHTRQLGLEGKIVELQAELKQATAEVASLQRRRGGMPSE